ncbi:LOW QUALITY PROTEIN: protein Red-like [Penaeus japonicus]|uniref:LOW QUALITY PROTEIN: protein Red-like n=1 Tax=Penaeus japonicus TaxID=27405 RepID=UPI001C70B2A6|nr:LOW QUALITY PROTEIN: protein Red-like [Penaeus japonicus]
MVRSHCGDTAKLLMPAPVPVVKKYLNPLATASHKCRFPKAADDSPCSCGVRKEPVSSVGAKTSSAEPPTQRRENKDDVRAAERKKKKSYYAKIKKEEEEKMAELAEKYRDRAKERRDGKNPDYQAEDPSQAGMGGYRAVAPDLKSGLDAAERRKQMIQESKFLGGDMEHTHLVKGLDYALLQKVRSEIQLKESEVMVEVEKPTEGPKEKKPPPPQPPMPPPQEEDELTFKTNVGRRIFNAVFNTKQSEFVDLFLPGRMAYAIDLDDEVAESDIPTVIIRSKADLQGIENMQATFTTNDIVIQKLTQILSYLRTGRANKKQKKKDKGKNEAAGRAGADDSIYGEIEITYSVGKSYAILEGQLTQGAQQQQSSQQVPPHPMLPQQQQPQQSKVSSLLQSDDYYTECYPGMAEMQDAIDDSDDEVDYTKMDMGNKKGPVGRWDFDTQEEYSDYMNQREAMPKAAFQYGVKMADGRKTRRIGKYKGSNAELNREWQQIQQILKRRKDTDANTGGPEKAPRYDY